MSKTKNKTTEKELLLKIIDKKTEGVKRKNEKKIFY